MSANLKIRKSKDIIPMPLAKCHDGEGTLMCKSLLDGFESVQFPFMHTDNIPAGVSIGLHAHTENEEIYYLYSGKGILTYDDAEFEMERGDISLCKKGHSHAFLATEDCVLIVIGSRQING